MAAGVGSRLDPLTRTVPKPLVPIVGRPVMEHCLHWLRRHGFKELVANLHHLPEAIRDYFGDGRRWGFDLHYSQEPELLGTAGGVKKNEEFLRQGTFIVVSGDGLSDIDLRELVYFHRSKRALATIALKEKKETSLYGVVVTDEAGHIVAFQEKPHPAQALSNLVNTGIYVFEPAIFDYIPAGSFYDFGKQLFPELVAKRLPFYGYASRDYWCDIGSLPFYRVAQYDAMQGRVKLEINGKKHGAHWLGDNCQVSPEAIILGAVHLGRNVRVSSGALIAGGTVIGDGCSIGENAIVQGSILWPGTKVGPRAQLVRCVIGQDCVLEEEVKVGEDVIVASGSQLKQGSVVFPD